MAYDPADLKLPSWLLALMDRLVRLRLPIAKGWHLGVTRPGGLYLIVMLGVVGAALYSGNNLLYLCGAFLLVMAAAAAWIAVRILKAVPDLVYHMPQHSLAGKVYVLRQPVPFVTRHHICADVIWEDKITCTLRCGPEGSLLFARLAGRPRGLYAYEALTLCTDAPLGLWHVELRRPANWAWAVVPTPVPWAGSGGSGGVTAVSPLEGDEWHDLRPYVPGDQPSRIHWRKAMMDDWTVKRFTERQGEASEPLLRVDLRGIPGPRFERLLGQAHHWMNMHPDGQLVLGQQHFDLKSGEARAWQALAAARPESTPPAGRGGILLALVTLPHAA